MIRQIQYRYSDDTFRHDDSVGEAEMRDTMQYMFTPTRGGRETFTIYRGFIIVGTTVSVGGVPERWTRLWIYHRVPGERMASVTFVGRNYGGASEARGKADEVLDKMTLRV